MTLRIAIVAGELSGDQLGGALAASLGRQAGGRLELTGVAGPSMRAAGVRPLADCRELAVMGLAEVIRHVPRLMRLRHELLDHFLRHRPDVFVGIDAPDFTLGLERRLHAAGIRTVHYVSPSVWAWRQGRIRGIRRSVDAMLTLLPFEAEFYRRHGVPVRFVGHPLADRLPDPPDRRAARRRLGLPEGARLIGLLPGSRRGEIDRLAEPFLAAASWLATKTPGAQFLLPLAHADLREPIDAVRARVAPDLSLQILEGGAHDVLEASDAAWVASGTATLEAMLLGCPMVVGYRLAPLTHALARHLVRTDHVALPNLLAGERLVPELIQDAATPAALGAAMQRLLAEPEHCASLRIRFAALREQLRAGGAEAAADAVLRVARGAGAGMTGAYALRWIAGVDEAGRGPLAGPVMAAAVILNPERPVAGLDDSKRLTPKRREALFELIVTRAHAWAIGRAEVAEIDEMNILQATLLAMSRAVAALTVRPDAVWIDGNQAPALPMPARTFIGGDRDRGAISAASILAKVARDREMAQLAERHPAYGFDRHQGYPTAAHLAALRQHGPSPVHRRSFAPVRRALAGDSA